MGKWEYKRVTARGDDDKILAEAGQDGWELVLTIRCDYVFKRPIVAAPITAAEAGKKFDESARKNHGR